jgi:hypothetical protein
MNIDVLPQFIIRVPLKEKGFCEKLSKESIINIFNEDTIIQEAIFLSSPEFFKQLQRQIKTNKIEYKSIVTLKKFLIRLSNRATPFGLFSGINLASFNNTVLKNQFILSDYTKYEKKTRLDMQLLGNIYEEIVSKKENRTLFTYFPNSSIYKIGNQYRYIEYKYSTNQQKHFINSIDYDDLLDFIFRISTDGIELNTLINCIKDKYFNNDINVLEIEFFIHELIDSQILISSIYPSISGNDYFEEILQLYKNENLDSINSILKEIDSCFNTSMILYDKLKTKVIESKFNFDEKFLIQTDMIANFDLVNLNSEITSNLKDILTYFIYQENITPLKRLENFKGKFFQRFEEKEISLALALDVESGISYLEENDSYDQNFLIDDIYFKQENDKNSITDFYKNYAEFEMLNTVMLEEYEEILDLDLNKNKKTISINNLPSTFSIICSIYDENGSDLIVLDSIYGSTALNLITRFSHLNDKINRFILDVSNLEQEKEKDVILAEILHLPEKRIGNIIHHKPIRNFEIPILSRSNLPRNQQLFLDDILISIKENKIILKSKRHNKLIKPYLSTAHNYEHNSIPQYRFLCDLQYQDKIRKIGYTLKSKIFKQVFFPRIRYKNIIISLAQWHFDSIYVLLHIDNIKDLCEKYKIPSKITLLNTINDNYLNLNLNDTIDIDILKEELKIYSKVIFKEIINLKTIVRKDNKTFNNEFVFSFSIS